MEGIEGSLHLKGAKEENENARVWTDEIGQAYDALSKSGKLSPDAKAALSASEQRWLDFKKVEDLFIDKVCANDPAKATEMKKALVKERVDELNALQDARLTKLDPNIKIDRQLGRCLSSGHSSGDTVMCLVDAQNNWQISKNQTLQDLAGTWDSDTLGELKKSELAWETFAQEEDRFLQAMYPDDSSDSAGMNRIKGEINVERHRALELSSISNAKNG